MANLNTYYYRVLLPHGGVRSGLLRLAVKRDLSARMRLEADTDGTVRRARPDGPRDEPAT